MKVSLNNETVNLMKPGSLNKLLPISILLLMLLQCMKVTIIYQTGVIFQMTTSSYSSVHQPFSMPHSATNMAPVSGLRQDAMGKFKNTVFMCKVTGKKTTSLVTDYHMVSQ
jgi:hypothetical protein